MLSKFKMWAIIALMAISIGVGSWHAATMPVEKLGTQFGMLSTTHVFTGIAFMGVPMFITLPNEIPLTDLNYEDSWGMGGIQISPTKVILQLSWGWDMFVSMLVDARYPVVYLISLHLPETDTTRWWEMVDGFPVEISHEDAKALIELLMAMPDEMHKTSI